MGFDLDVYVSWAKRRGFVYPGSSIYGGFSNAWDYGKYGILLKNNIRDLWWKKLVQKRDDIVGIDAQIIMNPKVWEASGHVGGFSDPLIDCKKCRNRFRADKLIEDYMNKSKDEEKPNNWAGEGTPDEDMINYLYEKKIKCPSCGALDYTEIRKFNLMFKTHQSVIEDDSNLTYLRPETCGGIFVNFKNILDTIRIKLPFGIAQVGKAFRNEITPGTFIFRQREFEQLEMEYFVSPDDAKEYFEYWKEWCEKWWTETIGIDKEKIVAREVPIEEAAHYSAGTYDFEYKFPWGWGEIQAFNNRTDYDLSNHMKFSGEDMKYIDPKTGKRFVPHAVEVSIGLSRTVFVAMVEFYDEEEYEDGNGNIQNRVVVRFPKKLAPIKFAILPLIEKSKEMIDISKDIFDKLSDDYMCELDIKGGIGKRYRRQDEIGTPYCITVDHQTLEDGTVTIRDRDSMEQKRIKVEEIKL